MGKLKKVLLVFGIVIVLLIASAYLLLRSAFGPIWHTYIIELSPGRSLICKEEYNADFAGVFYDVNFELIEGDKEIRFGQATFTSKNWRKDIILCEIDDWYVLPVNDMSYSKILFANKRGDLRIDTLLSPKNLVRDKLWRSKANSRPNTFALDKSNCDSIAGGKIFVTFNYGVGESEPIVYLTQQVSYRVNQQTGKLITDQIFDAAFKE